jgi:hypothetical protein
MNRSKNCTIDDMELVGTPDAYQHRSKKKKTEKKKSPSQNIQESETSMENATINSSYTNSGSNVGSLGVTNLDIQSSSTVLAGKNKRKSSDTMAEEEDSYKEKIVEMSPQFLQEIERVFPDYKSGIFIYAQRDKLACADEFFNIDCRDRYFETEEDTAFIEPEEVKEEVKEEGKEEK